MDVTEQLKLKVSHLLTQFAPGQTEPSVESLEVYKMSREQFRDGLLLLQADVAEQKRQQEAKALTDTSDSEAAKDKAGVSLEEDAKSSKAGTGLIEESASDQRAETTRKVLAGKVYGYFARPLRAETSEGR